MGPSKASTDVYKRQVLGGLHAAIAHGVGLERLGLAGLDGTALGGSPVEALEMCIRDSRDTVPMFSQ